MKIFNSLEQKIGIYSFPRYAKALFWLIISGAFLLALIPLYYQFTFGYDQSRDAYEAYQIWHDHNPKIIGPGTDFPGVYHGVLWFYLLALYYGVGNGNPLIAGYINAVTLLLSIFFVGYAAQKMTSKTLVAPIAMVLYAFSPLFQALTRWFSNPDPTIIVMPFLLVSLWKFLQKYSSLHAFLVGIWMGVIVQANFGYALLYVLFPVFLVLFKKLPNVRELAFFLLGSLVTLSTFILAEIKFNFRATQGVIHFFLAPHTTSSSVLRMTQAVLEKYSDLLFQTVFSFPWYGILLVTVGLTGYFLIAKKNSDKKFIIFLLIWLSNIVLYRVFSTGLTTSSFLFFPSISAIVLLVSYLLVTVIKNKILLFLSVGILVSFQLFTSYNWIKNDKTTLAVQHGINFYTEQKIIDYTYQAADYKPFIITTVTNPLYINTLWSYLYQFVGEKKYGYVPSFDGRSQKDFLGTLPMKKEQTEIQFLIFEPRGGIPDIYFIKTEYILNQYTDTIEEKKFGNFVVQKRVYHPNKPPIEIPEELVNSPILHE